MICKQEIGEYCMANCHYCEYHEKDISDILSRVLPDKQGWYWWWNEDPNSLPVPVSIVYSGTEKRYFASIGQLGWSRPQWVEDMGGKWQMLVEPSIYL